MSLFLLFRNQKRRRNEVFRARDQTPETYSIHWVTLWLGLAGNGMRVRYLVKYSSQVCLLEKNKTRVLCLTLSLKIQLLPQLSSGFASLEECINVLFACLLSHHHQYSNHLILSWSLQHPCEVCILLPILLARKLRLGELKLVKELGICTRCVWPWLQRQSL